MHKKNLDITRFVWVFLMLKYKLTFSSSFVTLHIYSSVLYPSTKCWTSGLINPKLEKILDHPFNDRSTRCI